MSYFSKNFLLKILYILVIASGFATLAWEVIWQIKASLALGVSAWGAAITLIVIMGGMSLGGLWMGDALRQRKNVKAVLLYGTLELLIGLTGFFFSGAFHLLEQLDVWAYQHVFSSISLVYIFGLILICGLPALCMGATLPVFGVIAQEFKISIAKLYSLNTLGAASGTLIVALLLIPLFGISHTILFIALMNMSIGVVAILFFFKREKTGFEKVVRFVPVEGSKGESPVLSQSLFIVFVTGFATFALEIAWFRALTNFYPNTTDVFASMLAAVLIALGLSAKNVFKLKKKNRSLGTQMSVAGFLILLITPIFERLDYSTILLKKMSVNLKANSQANLDVSLNWVLDPNTFNLHWYIILFYLFQSAINFTVICLLIIPPMRYLGVAFPWFLENEHMAPHTGTLYAINLLAAVLGAIGAAWILLPTIGFAKTAWLAGILVVIAGIVISKPIKKQMLLGLLGVCALIIAVHFETAIGKTHVQGYSGTDKEGRAARVLDFYEGADATTSAIEYVDGSRALLINGIGAAWESGPHAYRPSVHYMAWMGYLPMLLHPDPQNALVICFGTGQTSNAVRKENPQSLDIVDVNPKVFKLGHFFRMNESVLTDPRVTPIVMDGRAYLRRTAKLYDVITLEPMPPTMAGVNALYSKEFYTSARAKLKPNGVIAQWLPFHLAAPHYCASIAKTFMSVFPNAILWIDSESHTGILLGSKDDNVSLLNHWYGFSRNQVSYDLSQNQILQSIALNSKELAEYASYGEIITDDNQLLSYGKALYLSNLLEANFALLKKINHKIEIPVLPDDYK